MVICINYPDVCMLHSFLHLYVELLANLAVSNALNPCHVSVLSSLSETTTTVPYMKITVKIINISLLLLASLH